MWRCIFAGKSSPYSPRFSVLWGRHCYGNISTYLIYIKNKGYFSSFAMVCIIMCIMSLGVRRLHKGTHPEVVKLKLTTRGMWC